MSRAFQRILVPVDFSAYAKEALTSAADISARFSASLVVLHVIATDIEMHAARQRERLVVPRFGFIPGPVEVPEEVRETAVVDLREQAHTALQQFLLPELAGRPVELRVEVGHPCEQILETTRREHVDLIVMGTHGRTGLEHVLLGSITERVARLAPCPVLTVKAPTSASRS
jgi:nucleotide-binding universal stress UspA family protein